MEDDVVGLREAHDEDEVDDKESEKVFGDHPIDHDHKGADDLNRPGMISCAGKQGKGNSSKPRYRVQEPTKQRYPTRMLSSLAWARI